MGILIYCSDNALDELSLSMSYGSWHHFRLFMLQTTIRYLKHQEEQSPDIHPNIQNFLETMNYKESRCLTNFNKFIHSSSENLNAFISVHCHGLYALCYKQDSDGFYSVGNAFDILTLFQTIEPFFTIESLQFLEPDASDSDKKEVYDSIIHSDYDTLKKILEKSIETRTNITIL